MGWLFRGTSRSPGHPGKRTRETENPRRQESLANLKAQKTLRDKTKANGSRFTRILCRADTSTSQKLKDPGLQRAPKIDHKPKMEKSAEIRQQTLGFILYIDI